MATRVEGLTGSPSAHVLLGVDVDEGTLATARRWVAAQLLPEPSTLAVTTVCFAACVHGRR